MIITVKNKRKFITDRMQHYLSPKYHIYLSIRDGRIKSGLINARFCNDAAASKLPDLLYTASMATGFKITTNLSTSESFKRACSGGFGIQFGLRYLSLCSLLIKLSVNWHRNLRSRILMQKDERS